MNTKLSLKKTALTVFVSVIFVIAASCAKESTPVNIKVASFNLCRFGTEKAANTKVADFIGQLIAGSDVAALQEIIDIDEAAAAQFAKRAGANYASVLSGALGSGPYKEKYLFIYDTKKASLLNWAVYPDRSGKFERPPMAAHFRTGAFDFIVLDCHIKPDTTKARTTEEIKELPKVAAYFSQLWGESAVFIVGDFNADGDYYTESNLQGVFSKDAWRSLITDAVDTTVTLNNSFTYDRFFISRAAFPLWTGKSGVIRFDTDGDLRKLKLKPEDISDHYPIWAEFCAP